MIKYLHFVLLNGEQYIFPLGSLLNVRSTIIDNNEEEITIVFGSSSVPHNYTKITVIRSTEDEFIISLMSGIAQLQENPTKTTCTFIFKSGD